MSQHVWIIWQNIESNFELVVKVEKPVIYPTNSTRFSFLIAANTWVEALRCIPLFLSSFCDLIFSSIKSSNWISLLEESRRYLKYFSTVWSNTGYVNSSPNAYFQSILDLTASEYGDRSILPQTASLSLGPISPDI